MEFGSVSLFAAFSKGFLSFLTPCVFPMIPFYLSYLAGTNVAALKSETGIDRETRLRLMVNGLAFFLGLLLVFVSMGMVSTALGQVIGRFLDYFRIAAGILIIIFGLHFIGVFKIAFFQREARFQGPKHISGPLSAFLLGMAFTFGWTACVGPILASVLAEAALATNIFDGGQLLLAYGLGMGLPFLLASVFFAAFFSVFERITPYMHVVEVVAGVMMVIFGILILTGGMNYLSAWLIENVEFMNENL